MSQKRPEDRKEYNRRYYQENREKLLEKGRERVREWQQKNKEKRNENLFQKRQQEIKALGKSKNSEYNKRSRLKLKKDTMKAYGGQCVCCGESEIEFLVIDHINNDGAEHRRNNSKIKGGGAFCRWLRDQGYPKEFQILCCNCNWSKQLGGGVCIHQRNKMSEKTSAET